MGELRNSPDEIMASRYPTTLFQVDDLKYEQPNWLRRHARWIFTGIWRLSRKDVPKDIFTKRTVMGLFGALFVSAIHGLLIPLMSFILGQVFDDLSRLRSGALPRDEFMHNIYRRIATMGALAAGKLLAAFLQSFVCYTLADKFAQQARASLFDRALRMSMVWFERYQSGGTASASGDLRHVQNLHELLSRPLGLLVQGAAALTTAIFIAFYISWDLTLMILAGIPFAAAIITFCSFRVQRIEMQQDVSRRIAGGIIRESLKEVLSIKLLNGQKEASDRYRKAILAVGGKAHRQSLFNASQVGLLRFVGLAMFIQGLWYGAKLVRNGVLSPGQALTCFWACSTALESIDMLNAQLELLQRGLSSFRLLCRGQSTAKDEEIRFLPSVTDFSGDVCLDQISFRYPFRPERQVLQNVDMRFPQGQTTYIVGRSGSGKSTLGQLLAGLYQPTGGCLTVGGTELARLRSDTIRQGILYVSHDSALFSGSILANILKGSELSTKLHQAEIDIATSAAELDSPFWKLKEGLYTDVEHGSSLSGGQRQQVSIARALLRDAAVLILDEVTSAVDARIRASIWQNIAALRKGKTTIVITHDTAQIGADDLVYELSHGKVTQSGLWKDVQSSSESKGAVYLEKPLNDTAEAKSPGYNNDLAVKEQQPSEIFEDKNDSASLTSGHSTSSMLLQVSKEMTPQQVALYTLGCLSAILHAVCVPLFSYTFARLLSIIAARSSDASELTKWIRISLAIAASDAMASFAMLYLLDFASQQWVNTAYHNTFAILIDQPLAWIQMNTSFISELKECLDRETIQLRNMLGRFTGYKLSGLFMLLVCMIWSLAICWELTLVFLGIVPFLLGIVSIFESSSEKWAATVNAQTDTIASLMTEVFTKIKTVKCLRLEQSFRVQHEEERVSLHQLCRKRRIFISSFFAVANCLMIVIAGITIYFGSWLAYSKRREVTEVVSALTILLFGMANFNITISLIPQSSGGIDTYSRIRKVASLKREGESYNFWKADCARVDECPSLECDNVEFTYPSRPGEIVHQDLNLRIPAGKITVLAGPSGSGKSTIFQLFTELFSPNKGNLRINEQDISSLDPFSLRSQVICVPQEAPLFDGTVASNISFPETDPQSSSIRAKDSHSLMEQAAKTACIHNFITSLPNGYNTHISSSSSLSTGQRARITLARALYRQSVTKAKVLLLDEVLGCLDWETASQILRNLREMQEGRMRITICIISHDQRVEQFADHVIRLGGRGT